MAARGGGEGGVVRHAISSTDEGAHARENMRGGVSSSVNRVSQIEIGNCFHRNGSILSLRTRGAPRRSF